MLPERQTDSQEHLHTCIMMIAIYDLFYFIVFPIIIHLRQTLWSENVFLIITIEKAPWLDIIKILRLHIIE